MKRSKEALLGFADSAERGIGACENTPMGRCLRQAAGIIRGLAGEQEPEEPKVEPKEQGNLKMPSKARLTACARELDCVRGALQGCCLADARNTLVSVATTLRGLASEQEPEEPKEEKPEEPKVESLRQAAGRIYSRAGGGSNAMAHGLALVLGQVDRLAGLILVHRIGSAVYKAPREALRQFRAEISQMRDGCE